MTHNLTDKEQRLVELWGLNWSQSQIANDLGVTVGAVSGMAMRLRTRGVIQHKTREQLEEAYSRAASRRTTVTQTEKRIIVRSPPKPIVEALEPIKIIVALDPPVIAPPPVSDDGRAGIGIRDLTNRTCKWVLPKKGRDGMARYCGDAVSHRSFCEHHAARAFILPNDWKKQAAAFRKLRMLLAVR